MEAPKQILEQLLPNAMDSLIGPYSAPSSSPYRLWKEAEGRMTDVISKAYAAGYRQRDAEIITDHLKAE